MKKSLRIFLENATSEPIQQQKIYKGFFGRKCFCVCCDLDPHSRLCVLSRASGIQGYLWVAPGPTHFIVVMHKALFLFNL